MADNTESADRTQFVKVDKFLWNYITKSATFADSIATIHRTNGVDTEELQGSEVRVKLTSSDELVLGKAAEEIEQLIRRCEETVVTVRLPPQEVDIQSGILDNLDTLNKSVSGVIVHDGDVFVVTGIRKEVDSTIDKLREMYGLATSDTESIADSNRNNVSLRLASPVFELDTSVWQYMSKPGSQWVADIEDLRKAKKVTETIENEQTVVRLEATALKDDFEDARVKLQTMIDECKSQVKTLRTVMLDQRVYTKASKFMTKLNNSRAYVAAVSGTITVTGTDSEISECQEKLKKLGVNFDSESDPAASAESHTSSSFLPPVISNETSSPDVNEVHRVDNSPSFHSVVLPEHDRPKRPDSFSTPVVPLSNGGGNSSQGVTRQFPVPIEANLWDFVERRRSDDLQTMRDSLGVTVTSYPEGESVCIVMQADMENQLEWGQDALQALLGELSKTLVSINMGTEAGPMPSELGQLLTEIAADTDAIVKLSPGIISIIGPEAAAKECNQRIATIAQQVSGGGDGFGRRMGGMSDEGIASRQTGGVPLGGARMTVGGDSFEAMRSQRVQRLDNPMQFRNGESNLQSDIRSSTNEHRGTGNNTFVGSSGQGLKKSFQAEPPSQGRRIHFADDQPESGAKSDMTPRDTSASDTKPHSALSNVCLCSICQIQSNENQSKQSNQDSRHVCGHSFCVRCVQDYFSASESRCPMCQRGLDHETRAASHRPRTQPRDGIMSVTHDRSFRLPGHETRSRGTIVVVYSFPPGIQQDFQPHPGLKYSGVTQTAFFPLTTEGSEVVDQLQQAFDDGRVFAMLPSSDGKTDEIAWNGIQHKTSIHGGPQLCGYPDPFYVHHVQSQLKIIGV